MSGQSVDHKSMGPQTQGLFITTEGKPIGQRI